MSDKTIKILLVEDNPGDARLIREMLNDPRSHDMELSHVVCLSDAEKFLAEHSVDIILLDLGLPDAQGLAAVRRTHDLAPRVPLVVLTGMDDERLASEALQDGVQDYIVKGQIETPGLLRSLRYSIERKRMEEALFEEKERAEVTLNSIGDAVICTDVFGNITFLNIIAEKLTGWPREEAMGLPMSEVFKIVDAATRATILDPMKLAADRDLTLNLPSNCVLIRRNGHESFIEDSVAPIHNRQGEITGAVAVFRDVTAARAMRDQIAHLAEHDFLTGLPNRMLLNDRIGQAIALAIRHEKKIALLFLDLDGFKHINDSLGHAIGDKLLQSVAERLIGCVRISDTVSRQGGDEFVVLLTDLVHAEEVVITANRLLAAVALPHMIASRELHITTSIGVSVYPNDGPDAETLIKNSDTAMYHAKEKGHQNFQFFEPAMNVRAVERQSIEEGLRRALARQEFTLHYQPKIDLVTGAITGAEALIRWSHPTRGLVPPAEFIPVAEECGLILPIGAWVLREACRQTQAWIDAGLPIISVAVNVSAVELRDESFLLNLSKTLDETGLNPRSLELELTESVLMKRPAFTAALLQTLREWGVRVAIDDFGTGYSSLSYLWKLPIDTLKIDQSFVRQISSSGGEDTTIVASVISMARSLHLRVVAEGTETLQELQFLQATKCDEAQGYYFSQPLPAHQFEALLRMNIPWAWPENGLCPSSDYFRETAA
jgi:diguanylate cyclase (GGDEF)-like protein/PAS domain S-box-containing protein